MLYYIVTTVVDSIPKFNFLIVWLVKRNDTVATNPDQDHFNISVVTIGSSNRIISMPLFAGRWDGYIIYFPRYLALSFM